MRDRRVGRRALLAAAGAGVTAAIAGCTAPRSEDSGGTFEGASSANLDLDAEELADGSIFTELYEATIDSVAQVNAFGVDQPFTDEEGRAGGSAFLVQDRYLVTNEHVVADASAVDVQYIDGDYSDVTVVGEDYYSDLAVLEAEAVPDVADPLALREDFPVPGEQVLAIGNPFGLEGSMSSGIVSGVNRSLDMPDRSFSFPNVVQTDAGVNPGNSGGPLLDLDGDVVGVVNATGGENVGFAISAALTRRVVPALIETGEFEHPYLGITLLSVDRVVAEENDLEEARGVIVDEVVESPAAGVLEGSDDHVERHGEVIPIGGDVIVELDGEPIADRHDLSSFMALQASPGDTIAIEVIRDGSLEEVSLTLEARPDV